MDYEHTLSSHVKRQLNDAVWFFFLIFFYVYRTVFLTKYKSAQHHFFLALQNSIFIQLNGFFFTTFSMLANVPLLLLILCSFLIHNDTVIWEPSCIWSFQPSVQQFNFRKWMVFLWRKFALLVHKRMHKLVWKWSVGKLTTTLFQQVW